ncbi:N-acetylmuramoyl-L-alanine amidase [Anaerovoracaceae bacterium 41-7]|uniref:N-acetylmuramoyl-L-alanine amidase n=1 Tax=Emergencia sp. JLR.KK010 TaxID=3114296 RepID=UPI0030D24518
MSKIYWDAGHGGTDPGACANGLKEKDLALKVVKHACTYMKKTYVCDVYQDITDDSTTAISNRANKWEADLFVSVHFNAGGGDGYEALVYGNSNLKLGRCFEKRVKAIGQNSRGVKYRPDLNVLRLTSMKAILNECAFIDNKTDIKDWDEDDELQKMGEALAKACADWLNLKMKKAISSAPKEYKVKVPLGTNVYKEARANSAIVNYITNPGVFTIVETIGNYGRLKSGAGWINVKRTTKL